MQDYECREQLEDCPIVFHSFPRHPANLNPCARASATLGKEKIKQLREQDAGINSQFLLRSNSTIPTGLEEVKWCLVNCSDEIRITALKEVLKYGKEGFRWVENWEHPTQSDSITANSLNQEAIALKAQLDQQTLLVNNLLPDLVLISKLFEAKAKKHLAEAQTFAQAIEQIEKAFLKIEAQWQELESVIDYEQLPCKLLQLLESLISEMQNHLMLLRQTIARAITTQLQIQHHYNLAKKAVTYCEYRAQLDWQEGNENWARESLVRRKTYVDTATILKLSLEQQLPQLESLKCHLFVLQTWLSLAGQMKNTLKVGSSFTWVQKAQALLWHRIEFPYNTSSMIAELERIQ